LEKVNLVFLCGLCDLQRSLRRKEREAVAKNAKQQPITQWYMNRTLLYGILLTLSFANIRCNSTSHITSQTKNRQAKGLKDYYKDYFPIGVAVSVRSLSGADAQLIVQQFNSVTAENAMKMGPLHPEENRYNWAPADSIVNFAQKHGLKVRGHTLCWHEQTPRWLFKDSAGNTVSKEVLLKRLKEHINTIVSRYKGKVYAWDVVNEAVDDDSSRVLRNSLWHQICGDDFIIKAFEYAHAADPNAVLFYNDYNTERPKKMERIYLLLKKLVAAKVPIHGVGLQAHWSIYEPTENELRNTIEKFSSLGLKVQFTELDISVYPWEKNRRQKRADEADTFTPEREEKQLEQYRRVFKIFREYKSVITGITFWGVSDKRTWLDEYPVAGRKNYPLLFDQNLQPKKAYKAVIEF
jgi:endo-1,4-beta-xylanase